MIQLSGSWLRCSTSVVRRTRATLVRLSVKRQLALFVPDADLPFAAVSGSDVRERRLARVRGNVKLRVAPDLSWAEAEFSWEG
jgi:hypothetical protein